MKKSFKVFILGSLVLFANPAFSLERSCTSYIQLIYGMNKNKTVSELRDLEGIIKVNKEFREKILKASQDKESRELMTDSILTSMRKRSRILANKMKETSSSSVNEESQVHDVFVVGAGVQSSIFTQGIKQTNPDVKMMVVEETDLVASTFAMSPDYFRINSTSRKEDFSTTAVPGSGNINRFSGGSVQVPDFEANKYPRAGAIADVALYNLFESEAEVLFKTKFVRAQKRGPNDNWPAKYRITIRRGDKEYYQYANKVVNATGLGTERYGLKDEASLKLIKQERMKSLEITRDSKSVPRIMTFNDARRLNKVMDNPYAPYAGKKVMIVGNGDSGKVTIEHLFREGPEDGYKGDKAQAGTISKLIWAGQKEQDCKEYVNTNRVRYSSIAAAYKNGTLKPVDSKVVKYEEILGGVKVTFADGREEIVDHVITSTGFEKEYASAYSDFVGSDVPGDLEKADGVLSDVKGKIREDRNSDFTTVGVQLTNSDNEKEDIYFLGPMVNLIRAGEEGLQAGVSQNSVSIFINGPRNFSLGALLAENINPMGVSRLADSEEKSFKSISTNSSVVYQLDDSVRAAKVTGYNEKFILSSFLSSLEGFNLQDFAGTNISIKILNDNGKIKFLLNDGSSNSFNEVVSEVLANPKNQEILKQIIFDEEMNLSARVKIKDDGDIDYEGSKIAKSFEEVDVASKSNNKSAKPEDFIDGEESAEDILRRNMERSFSDSKDIEKKSKTNLSGTIEINYRDSAVSSSLGYKIKYSNSFSEIKFSNDQTITMRAGSKDVVEYGEAFLKAGDLMRQTVIKLKREEGEIKFFTINRRNGRLENVEIDESKFLKRGDIYNNNSALSGSTPEKDIVFVRDFAVSGEIKRFDLKLALVSGRLNIEVEGVDDIVTDELKSYFNSLDPKDIVEINTADLPGDEAGSLLTIEKSNGSQFYIGLFKKPNGDYEIKEDTDILGTDMLLDYENVNLKFITEAFKKEGADGEKNFEFLESNIGQKVYTSYYPEERRLRIQVGSRYLEEFIINADEKVEYGVFNDDGGVVFRISDARNERFLIVENSDLEESFEPEGRGFRSLRDIVE